MKKTQRKDAFRNISKQFVSYFSIIVISMLAVGSFLSINFSADALIANASRFYDRLHFRDFEVTSTMLLTEDDIAVLRNLETVSDVEGVYQTSAQVFGEARNVPVYVISQTERISLADTIQGRMPENADECALEKEILEQLGIGIGDTVKIGSADGSCAPFMLQTEFVVTGSFLHADHYALKAYSSGNRFVIVRNDAFDLSALDGCYTKANITLDKPDKMNVLSGQYDTFIKAHSDSLKELAEERAAERDNAVRTEYTARIDEGQAKLDDVRQQLADGRKKLDDSAKLIADNEKKLADGKKQLDSAKKKLDAAKKKLNAADGQLKAGKKKLDAAENTLRSVIKKAVAGTEYESHTDEYVKLIKSYLASNSVDKLDARLSQVLPQEVLESEEYQTYYSSIKKQAKQYSDGLKQYNKGMSAYKKGLSEYRKGLKKYNSGMAQYRSGVKKLNNAKKQLAEGEKKYTEGLEQFEAGEKELQEAKDAFGKLKPCHWIVLDAQCNPGYVHARSSAENIRKLAMTFALLFVLIGVLIIYATVARIVDEQRKLVGTVKALGFFNREAAAKYLLFGLSGTFLGIALGTAFSYFVLQPIIVGSHKGFYVTDGVPLYFNLPLTLTAFAVGLLIAFLSVWWACGELVRHPAVELMKDKMPSGKTAASPKKVRQTSLYSRLILRNMRMDIRRVAITVVSVAGCCILLVIGFTLQHGIIDAIETEYNDILKYDQQVSYDTGIQGTDEQAIRELLDKNGVTYTNLYSRFVSLHTGTEMAGGYLICGDKDEIADNIALTDFRTGEKIVPKDRGIYLMRRTAEYYRLVPGDTVTLYDEDMQPYDVTVEGVFQNYVGVKYIMTRTAYQSVFGKEAENNCFLLKNCKDISGFSEELSQITGVTEIVSNTEYYDAAMKAAASLRLINAVLIVTAGIMAYFILLNLANMYINQKKRELTVMRVNGFTTGEVIAYVVREAVVTTIAGIIVGIAVGSIFAYAIVKFIEQRHAGFDTTPSFSGWLYSAGLTALYSVIIYAISLRKVKDLKLTDII